MAGKNGSTQGNTRPKNPQFVMIGFMTDFNAGKVLSHEHYLKQVAPNERETLMLKMGAAEDRWAEATEQAPPAPTRSVMPDELRDLQRVPKNFRNVHQRRHA